MEGELLCIAGEGGASDTSLRRAEHHANEETDIIPGDSPSRASKGESIQT